MPNKKFKEYKENKRKELERMIPGFIEKEYTDIVLDFYERGIDCGIKKGMQLVKEQMMKDAIPRKVKFLDSISYNHCIAHLGMSEEDTVKLILVKEG